MKFSRFLYLYVLIPLLFVGCDAGSQVPPADLPAPEELPQKRPGVEGRFLGGDISVLQSYEDKNVPYYDADENKIDDVLKYMKSEKVGWNAQRVRLFVDPKRVNPDGGTDAQVCQDIDYVVRLSKRIKEEGFALLLDIHYSDTWADPSNQWIPSLL